MTARDRIQHAVRTGAHAVVRIPQVMVMGAIRTYQTVISPAMGPTCKYYPSCSHYGLEAVKRHGAIKGSVLAAWRILRCNPWSNGGVDEVPAVGEPLFRRHMKTSTVTT